MAKSLPKRKKKDVPVKKDVVCHKHNIGDLVAAYYVDTRDEVLLGWIQSLDWTVVEGQVTPLYNIDWANGEESRRLSEWMIWRYRESFFRLKQNLGL
jgi:hypothetical protein